MHSAPSVSYPVGRSRFAGALLLLIWLLAASATGLWWTQLQAPGWRVGAAALLSAGAGALAAWNWWHAPKGTLAWDGETWSWLAQARLEPGEPEVSLDLQRWLLLRWSSGHLKRWLWLERAASAERWDDLRRAVYSRARPPAPRQDQQPAASP